MTDKISKGSLDERMKNLSPEKRELLLKKIREQKQQENPEKMNVFNKVSRDGELHLSYVQKQLWFFDQFEPNNSLYNMPTSVRFEGKLDVAVLQRVFAEIIRRHETLRTIFIDKQGEPFQVIKEPYSLEIATENLLQVPEDKRDETFLVIFAKEASKPFDLKKLPLLRARLLKFKEDVHVLILVMHHIITDGWSMGILVNELNSLYNSYVAKRESELPELDVQYVDYVYWQQEWLKGERYEKLLSYWKKHLENVQTLSLPTDFSRPPVQKYRGARYSFVIAENLTLKMKELCAKQKVTLYMGLFGVFGMLVSKISGQDNICIGTPIANRNNLKTEAIIGFFVNLLAIHINPAANSTFLDYLQEINSAMLAAYEHQDFPFERLVDELVTERDLSRNPLFQVAFVLQNMSLGKLKFSGLSVKEMPTFSNTSAYDLKMDLFETGSKINGVLEYNIDLFTQDTIKRLAAYYQQLLSAIVDDPSRKISEYSMLTETDYKRMLLDWNKTDSEFAHKTIAELFEAQVARTPRKPAVIWQGEQLSYEELNNKSNQLARYLQSLGAGPNKAVGLCVNRSIELFIGLLGIIKSGAAYIPMDPDYPRDRLLYMLSGQEVIALVTLKNLQDIFPDNAAKKVLIDTDWPQISKESVEKCQNDATPEDLIYVIYTSGSTGKPKGIEVCHKSVANVCAWHVRLCGIDADTRSTQIAGLGFDATGLEYWPYLTSGATLYPVPRDIILSPVDLVGFYQENKITHSFAPTPIAEKLFLEKWPENNCLKMLLTGGEKLKSAPPAGASYRVLDHYGPAEATITTTSCFVEPKKEEKHISTIGRPIDNMKIYILDNDLHPVPIGVAGEIYISGIGLAKGYRGQPDLTAERFIVNPFSEDQYRVLYKTGDLAKYLADGQIQFIGRTDFQVKIRGFRIELGEIEETLKEKDDIREAVVVAKEDANNNTRLVAYIVLLDKKELDVNSLKAYLKAKLPDYMVPSTYMQLEQLPLTENGKVDRKVLPEPDLTQSDVEFVSPRNETEEDMAAIWKEVLNLDKVGVYSNFFDLGGHSLLATQVISRIRDTFGVDLSVRVIFENATIAALAESVRDAKKNNSGIAEQKPIRAIQHNGEAKLSFAQQRLWFLEKVHSLEGVYNMACALMFDANLKIDMLEKAFSTIVERHESLRTTFFTREGEPFQKIHAPVAWKISLTEFGNLNPDALNDELNNFIQEAIKKPFDLEKGPLFRTVLFSPDQEDFVLLIIMHHIISDGWSIKILLQEIVSLYTSYANNQEHNLPQLAIQYADYARWQKEYLESGIREKQLAYWKEELAGIRELELPFDYNRPDKQSFIGSRIKYTFDKGLSAEIKALTSEQGVTLFMTLYAAFNVLLYNYSGQTDLCLGTPIANRNKKEFEPLIGFFANTLVLRTDLSGDPTFIELLKQAKDKTLKAYENQDLPFDILVDELQPDRDLSSNPLFQAVFAVQNVALNNIETGNLKDSILEKIDNDKVRFDLEVHSFEAESGIVFYFVFSRDLFNEDTITKMAEHYKNLAQAIVASPHEKISKYSMLSDEEKQELLRESTMDELKTSTDDALSNIDNLSEADIDALLDKF